MSSEYKDRYGISGKDVTNLVRKFYRRLYDSDWERADDFVKWCSENGYESGLWLCRYDESKPHGPENSYFRVPKIRKSIKEDKCRRKEERKNFVSPFCVGCQNFCPGSGSCGCEEWQEYFKNNWDKNISIAPKKPEPKSVVQEGPMVFRYEHPDLVREGIVFEASR